MVFYRGILPKSLPAVRFRNPLGEEISYFSPLTEKFNAPKMLRVNAEFIFSVESWS